MRRFLATDVHAAAPGGDVVFLDIRQDRYLCVAARRGVCLGPAKRQVRIDDPALADELAAAGLTAMRPSEAGIAVRAGRRPTRDLPLPERERLNPRDWAQAAVATGDALLSYRARTLRELLTMAAESRRGCEGEASTAIVQAAAQFRRWAPFTPLPSKCLLRSFMLLRHLRRAGLDADWVFGVATRPFAAHCWVQAGDMALDDDWERLARFEPILAV